MAKCPHCSIAFHPEFRQTVIPRNRWRGNAALLAHADECPSCKNPIIYLQKGNKAKGWDIAISHNEDYYDWGGNIKLVWPNIISRSPPPIETPSHIAEDYIEASKIVSLSPKASAALARRCLQALLKDVGYTKSNLVDQINDVLKESDPKKAIPGYLRDQIDAVRNFGNFSAHPITDQSTLQIIPVEAEEAEWCLDIILSCIDHYYVSPANQAKKLSNLNAKLMAAGKPPPKT
jgi:hypothetical protein